MKLALTPRWTPLRPHRQQELYFWHPAAIKVNPSGRRSGKTELVKRKAVLKLRQKLPWPGKYAIGAPTREQVHDIYWEDIKALVPRHWVRSINETRMEIVTKWGAMLRLLGLDRPERAEGIAWDHLFIDELADCPTGLLDAHLLPAMGTIGRTPSLDLVGVPDEVGPNQAEYEKYFTLGLQWPAASSQGVCSFHWRSDTVLEPEKIAFFKATMDPQMYEQEMGGRFMSSGGKAFPRFDVISHVSDFFCEYSPLLPIDWMLDFGLHGKGVGLIGQQYGENLWLMDEIICPDSSTDVQVMAFRERCAERGYRLYAGVRRFGDASGRNGQIARGESDYQIIDQAMHDVRMDRLELDRNPPIKDTVNAVRSQLLTMTGRVRLHIHPRCKTTIEHLKTAPWPAKLEEFHCLAALRYWVYALFGAGVEDGISVGPRQLPGQ